MIKNLPKALFCFLLGLIFFATQTQFISSSEAKLIQIEALIENDVPNIDIPGGKFCTTDAPAVVLSSDIEAEIWYTLDGTNPACGLKGNLYTGPITLPSGESAVQAVTCHNGKQSIRVYWIFDVSEEHCPVSLMTEKPSEAALEVEEEIQIESDAEDVNEVESEDEEIVGGEPTEESVVEEESATEESLNEEESTGEESIEEEIVAEEPTVAEEETEEVIEMVLEEIDIEEGIENSEVLENASEIDQSIENNL